MKKFALWLPLAIVLLWGCSKEETRPQESPKGTRTVTLSFGTEPGTTKGIFVDDKTFQWTAGDQIGVYLYSSTLENVAGAYNVTGKYGPWIAPFDLTGGAGTGSGLFSRELNNELGETYGNVAIYPYTEGSSFAYAQGGGTLTFNLPSYYKELDNLDMVRIPMVAKLGMEPGDDKTRFELKHVGGAVKVTLQNVPAGAKYFKLWATEGGNLSGSYTIDINQVGTGTLQGNGSENFVELQLKQGQAAASLDVYFPVPAGTYKLGVGVYGDGVTYLEHQGTTANTIGRGTILRMPALTIPGPNLGPYADYQSPTEKAGGLIYQVNVYSFADSDGDGIGDFKGIENHLDYLDKLGITALWLSPSQVAQSYHGYDISDYTALNPAYGSGTHTSAKAEADFQSLINTAHARNIRIYMDYVINHTGDQHPWFQDVKRNGPASPYWNYYVLSADPQADVNAGRIQQIPQGWYNSGEWFPALTGAGLTAKRYAIDLDWTNASAPTFTVSETTEAVTSGGAHDNPARYLLWGDGTYTQFADNGANKYRLVLDYQSDWGCLVRTTNGDDWSNGTKWGFNAMDQIALNTPHTLYTGASDDVRNILMPDGALYYYYSAFFTGMMPDINYGWADQCENSPTFTAIVATVDKWLNMGLDGLRLDAVKHVFNTAEDNVKFWQKFYSAVNAKYAKYASKRSGLEGKADQNIFMVGEVLDGESTCRPYYAGLPAIFEFQFWWDLRDALNNDSKGNFVSGLCDRYYRHQEVRGDAIPTPKLTNHDEDRAASVLYERHRIRQAAAVMLTAPGRPIVYQGEELGYWGTGANGDEYRRAPILWTSDISSAATHGVNDRYDASMLTPSISVAAQAADEESLLTLYRRFAYARNTNAALADGHPEYDNKTGENNAIMGWYMHANDNSGKTCLVLHNISGSTQTVQRWDGDNVGYDTILVASDPVSISGQNVTMPPYSSVVFALN